MSLNHNPIVRTASTIVLLVGLWFSISPWFFRASSAPTAFNNWMVGGMIVTFAFMRLTQPGSQFASWTNALLGLWVIASPWIQAYAFEPARMANTLVCGIVVTIAALVSARVRTYPLTT